jgi:citrate lyase beta subunit
MNFDLILFYRDDDFTRAAVEAGIRTIIVDWEKVDKHERQRNFDTQVNSLSARDLGAARACSDGHLICRINSFGTWTESEMKTAMEYGADEILLPMVDSIERWKERSAIFAVNVSWES